MTKEKELESELTEIDIALADLVGKRLAILDELKTVQNIKTSTREELEKKLVGIDNRMAKFTEKRIGVLDKLKAKWDAEDEDSDDDADGVYFNLDDLKAFVRQQMQEEWPQVEAALMIKFKKAIDELAAKWKGGQQGKENSGAIEKGMLCLGNFCGLFDGALDHTLDRKLLKDCYNCGCGHLCLSVTQVRIQSIWNKEMLDRRL